MINQDKRDLIAESDPEAVVFDNPSFDNSIIGMADGKVVYDFDSMVEELATDEDMTLEDSMDFICYNTVRSLPYIPNAPIIMYRLD